MSYPPSRVDFTTEELFALLASLEYMTYQSNHDPVLRKRLDRKMVEVLERLKERIGKEIDTLKGISPKPPKILS